MHNLMWPALCLTFVVASCTALQPGAFVVPRRQAHAAILSRRHAAPRALWVTKQTMDGGMTSEVEQLEDCAIIDPDAVNLLACHFIAHHRSEIVEFINRVAFSRNVLGTIDGFVGDLLSVQSIRFDITGPLEPQNYFHCYEVTVTRALERPDLVYADLTVEYKNQLALTLDALRFRGAVRGNSSAANLYRWMTTPIRGTSPLMIKLAGHAEGAAKLRLTLQTSQDVAFPTLAHIRITDASKMAIVLDEYDLHYLGPAGLVVRFVAGQLPLKRLQSVVNDAVQGVFLTYAEGWPINGGVQEERLGSWSRRKKRPKRFYPKIAPMSQA